MNWDAIAAIGQAFSAVALFGVFVQVRHARDEARRSISHNRLEAVRDLQINRTNNERLQGIAMKALTALGGKLSPFQTVLMERAGLTVEQATALIIDLQVHRQCHVEAIPYASQLLKGERIAFDKGLRSFYSAPLGAFWYESSKSSLDPDPVRYVDNVLAQPS